MVFLIYLINILVELITLLILAHVLLSFFMSPFHPIRRKIEKIVQPMLNPLRRYMPQTGMLDFSPMVLILLLYILRSLVVGLLR